MDIHENLNQRKALCSNVRHVAANKTLRSGDFKQKKTTSAQSSTVSERVSSFLRSAEVCLALFF